MLGLHLNTFRHSAIELELSSSNSGGTDLPYDRNSQTNLSNTKMRQNPSAYRHSNHVRRFINEQKRKSLLTSNTSGASIMYPGKMTTKDKRLLKMILVIFLAFIVCYLPITLLRISQYTTNKVLYILSYVLIFMTTCINPIIYVLMSSEYRKAYWNLLTCSTNQTNATNIKNKK